VKLPGTHQDERRRGSCAKGRSHSHRDKIGPAKRAKIKASVLRRRARVRPGWDIVERALAGDV